MTDMEAVCARLASVEDRLAETNQRIRRLEAVAPRRMTSEDVAIQALNEELRKAGPGRLEPAPSGFSVTVGYAADQAEVNRRRSAALRAVADSQEVRLLRSRVELLRGGLKDIRDLGFSATGPVAAKALRADDALRDEAVVSGHAEPETSSDLNWDR